MKNKKIRTCKDCGIVIDKKFIVRCDKCREQHNKQKIIRYKNNHKQNIYNGKVENIDYVICQICGQKQTRVFGPHLNSHNITTSEYKKLFPDCLIQCSVDKSNMTKNAGKFMKEPKWRKWAADRIKGEKNPNHKSRTTEQQRKEISPFSKEFYNKRGLSEDDRNNFIKEATKNINYNTRIDYYLKQGFSEEESILMLKERQAVGRLDRFIERYGEEEGLKRWKERQEKWKNKVFNETTNISHGSSLLSKEIINKIIEFNHNNNNLLYGKDEMFIYDNLNKRSYKYDLTNLNNKHIIEINGIFWHCKPGIYESTYYHKIKKMNAIDIWNYDNQKINIAKKNGYEILIIWEDDYYKNNAEVINKCIKFLYG